MTQDLCKECGSGDGVTPERFRQLWYSATRQPNSPHVFLNDAIKLWQERVREVLTAFVESEAMREKAEFNSMGECDCLPEKDDPRHTWTDADWINATWEKWLGRQP